MPCTITAQEAAHYERETNRRRYGVDDTDARIAIAVACEATKLLESNGLLEKASPLLKTWLENHKSEDVKRVT
ncbi:MAG: hypothetical protein ACRDAM_14090 [Casimicrobium sp.]